MAKMEARVDPRKTTGHDCPDCGQPEWSVYIWWFEPGHGSHHAWSFSCSHHHLRWLQDIMDPECDYCHKRGVGAKVRQVPAKVPISDCYCDNPECVAACAVKYERLISERAARLPSPE